MQISRSASCMSETTSPDKSAARSRQMLLITAALFSTGGVVIKAIHMPGPQIGSLRSGFAALALMLLVPETRRNWNLPVLGLSLIYALTLVTFAIANKMTTSANAIFLQETATLYILVFSAASAAGDAEALGPDPDDPPRGRNEPVLRRLREGSGNRPAPAARQPDRGLLPASSTRCIMIGFR